MCHLVPVLLDHDNDNTLLPPCVDSLNYAVYCSVIGAGASFQKCLCNVILEYILNIDSGLQFKSV